LAGQTTQAFVLKTQDYRDTSLLATFYTRDFGKVRAIIKGGRDARYRYGSTLEPFSLNEIVVYQRKRGASDLHLVTAAELLESFEPLRRDLGMLGSATYFLELIDQLTDTGHPHPEVYELLQEALAYMCRGQSARAATRILEVKLMTEMGLMPELTHCVRCNEEQEADGYFSISSGGVVCMGCRKGEGPLVAAPRIAVDFLNRLRREPFSQLENLTAPAGTAERIEKLMRQFVDFHLGYKPRSLTFLEKIGVAE